MKYGLILLLLAQLLIANEQFSSQEQSVFGQVPQANQQKLNKEIITYEQEQNNASQQEEFSSATDDNLNINSTENTQPLTEQMQQTIPASEETLNDTSVNVLQQILEAKNSSELTWAGQDNKNKEVEIDYFSEVIFDNENRSKSLYLSYLNYPKKVYKKQRFEIVLKALVTTDDFYKIETRFINAKNMTVLNPKNAWTLKQNNTFENRYYFKAYEENFVMPNFQVLLYKDGQIIESQIIKPEVLDFTEIGKDDERFSSVIAKSLTINAFKTKQYNNNELITILDVKAVKSNLEDFELRYIQEQGFSKIVDNYPEQNMLYYLVLPVHKKKIVFNYYNSQEKNFKTITIPVKLENELISTQTDLNPNNSNLLLYKKIALSVLALIFFILFVWKRKYVYLIITLICVIFLLVYFMPHRQAFVKSDTTIYILPTNNSTIFYKTKKTNVVQVDMKKENFVKIIMNVNNKKIIGWIKEEQLVEN